MVISIVRVEPTCSIWTELVQERTHRRGFGFRSVTENYLHQVVSPWLYFLSSAAVFWNLMRSAECTIDYAQLLLSNSSNRASNMYIYSPHGKHVLESSLWKHYSSFEDSIIFIHLCVVSLVNKLTITPDIKFNDNFGTKIVTAWFWLIESVIHRHFFFKTRRNPLCWPRSHKVLTHWRPIISQRLSTLSSLESQANTWVRN